MFYLDNISFQKHVLNQLYFQNESLISQAPNCTIVLTICFHLFKKQTILWRQGGRKKNEMNGDVPVSDMRHAFRTA